MKIQSKIGKYSKEDEFMKLGTRLNIIIGIVLSLFWSIAVIVGIWIQSIQTNEIVKDQAIHTANSIMNGLNLLMLNNQMEKSDFIYQQANKIEGIRNVYTIRSQHINKVFNKDLNYKKHNDEFERKVLDTGEIFTQKIKEKNFSEIRIIVPYIAKSDRLGINCLGCHQAKEGQVLGALNIVFSIKKEEEFTKQLEYILIGLALVGVFVVITIVYFTTKEFITKPLHELEIHLESVSNGDLTQELESKGLIGEIKNLYNSLHKMINSFKVTLKELSFSSEELKSSSISLNESSELILQNSKEQIKSISNSSESLESLSYHSSKVGSHSEMQATLSDKTTSLINDLTESLSKISKEIEIIKSEQNKSAEQIQKSHDSLDLVQKNILEIDQSAKGISEIMTSINEIADQTQLLSLNASIEAARVGELGKGFGVVAQEIRKLAENSTSSAENVKKLISKNLSIIQKGSNSMNEINENLENLFKSVEKNTSKVNEIAAEFIKQTERIIFSNEKINELDKLSKEINNLCILQSQANSKIRESFSKITSNANQFIVIANELSDRANRFKIESHNLQTIIKKFKF
jgi:methyl-accepting chemotaxis protein